VLELQSLLDSNDQQQGKTGSDGMKDLENLV
jgi:hypothetical protein